MIRNFAMTFLASAEVGISALLVIFCFINDTLCKRKKYSLLFMALCSAALAVADRAALYYAENEISSTGYFVRLRIAKFFAYSMVLLIILSFNYYLKSFLNKDKIRVVDWILCVGMFNILVTQFTGFYYSVDETGYERGSGYLIGYILPISCLVIQLVYLFKSRTNIRRRMLYPMVAFIIMPIGAAILHVIIPNISIMGMTIVCMTVLLYTFSIIDTNHLLKDAQAKEIEMIKQKEAMNTQITAALVRAIDAKDQYTSGHSTRVSEYSAMIAEKFGKSEEEVEEIRFIALLHDVGKIGVPGSIINKPGKLTDEEYEVMKSHTIIGRKILGEMPMYPKLRIGAAYHHERYDGKGYPFGMKGEEIPEIARIIAVADAYDAMTSMRSYRDALPQEVVREQLVKGIGQQFDPEFAKIMIELVDNDKDYNLRQKN